MTAKGEIQQEITPAKIRKFFDTFSVCGNIKRSCEVSGLTRQSVYRLQREDKVFAERFNDAREDAADVLEHTAWKRAVNGVVVSTEPVMYYGQQVGEKITKKYSDGLLTTLLQANRPEKFKQTQVQVNIDWQNEVEKLGIDPQQYLAQMVEQVRKQLEADTNVIDVTNSINESSNEHATRSIEETRGIDERF